MSISLKLPGTSEMVKRKSFSLPKSVSDEFDLYLEAAQTINKDCTEGMILQAIIEKQLRSDKEFKRWVKASGESNGKDDDGDGLVDEAGEKQRLEGLMKRRNEEATLYFQ